MKKIVQFFASTVFAVCLTSFTFSLHAQCSDVTNTTQSLSYCSLQAALDAANPGDVIVINNDILEGKIVVSTAGVTICGASAITKGTPTERVVVSSTSADHGIVVGAAGVTIKDIELRNAGTYGIIAAPNGDGLTLNNVLSTSNGLSGIALNCADGVSLIDVESMSNGGNALTMTDCQNVTINGFKTDGENKFFSGAQQLPFGGGIGIFATGASQSLCGAPGVNGVTITGDIDIQEFEPLYSMDMTSINPAGVTGVVYNPNAGSTPASLPYFVGSTPRNKAYVPNLEDAKTCAASLVAAQLSVLNTVYIERVSSGSKIVAAGVTPLIPPDPIPSGYSIDPVTFSINTAIGYAAANDTVFICEGDYYENVVVDKALILQGPDFNVDRCGAAPPTKSSFIPSTSAVIYPATSVANAIVYIQSSDVQIWGLTLDGDHPTITPGTLDANRGIYSDACNNNLIIKYNEIRNVIQAGIEIQKVSPLCTAPANVGNISYNKIHNVQGPPQGFGVEVRGRFDYDVTHNCVDNCDVGVRFGSSAIGDVTNNIFGSDMPNATDVLLGSASGIVNLNGYNAFSGTDFGVNNLSSHDIDARNNFWGDGLGGPGATWLGSGAPINDTSNIDFCPWLDAAPPTGVPVSNCSPVVISGYVYFEDDGTTGVEKVPVNLSGGGTASDTTDASGFYELTYTGGQTNFTITPVDKNIMPLSARKLNGVSAVDATRIQQHVTGLNPFTSPYKRIAADVNSSKTITTADAAVINQSLLGNPVALNIFCCGWRYVPESYVFPNPSNPWSPQYPSNLSISVTPFVESEDNNFIGIKVGDVDGSANVANKSGFSYANPLLLQVDDQVLEAGKEVVVPVRLKGFVDIAALQFSVGFNQDALAFKGLSVNPNGVFTDDNFGLFHLDQGRINSVMSAPTGVYMQSGVSQFDLTFEALEGNVRLSDVLFMDNSWMEPLAADGGLSTMPVDITFASTTSSVDLDLNALSLSARPNPAKGFTTVFFNMPEEGDASIRVIDVAGRLVAEQHGRFASGAHSTRLEFGGATGLLFVELMTNNGQRVVRVVAE